VLIAGHDRVRSGFGSGFENSLVYRVGFDLVDRLLTRSGSLVSSLRDPIRMSSAAVFTRLLPVAARAISNRCRFRPASTRSSRSVSLGGSARRPFRQNRVAARGRHDATRSSATAAGRWCSGFDTACVGRSLAMCPRCASASLPAPAMSIDAKECKNGGPMTYSLAMTR